MNLTIYQFEHSPYCIPITRALDALDISYDKKNVPVGDRREVIELTGGAYYQVPVLLHGEKIIYESSPSSWDVAKYVDGTFGENRLFPREFEGWQRIVLPYIENEVESVTFRLGDPCYLESINDVIEHTLIRRHKERKFGVGCIERWKAERDQLTKQTEELLAPFDDMLRYRPFLFGERAVYCDFALYGILGNLTYRDYNKVPRQLEALITWFEKMKEFHF